jgi:hypothetical protein
MRRALALVLLGFARAALAADADEVPAAPEPPEDWSLHGQLTYIAQKKPAFDAAYTGPHSLIPEKEYSYSFTGTVYGGARLWQGGEAYLNIEGIQGQPFSNQTGMGGFPNAELQKSADADFKYYRARLFWRQTFGFGGGEEAIDADANQLRTTVDKRRLVFTVGYLAIGDLFDNNKFSHDVRTDFQNGSLLASGAYDYAANARGYTAGFAAEWHDVDWAVRAGRFMQPQESNGLGLDTALFTHFGDQIEYERGYAIGGREGRLRVLAYHNVAVMGRYRDAIALGQQLGEPPDITLVRKRNEKWGWGGNIEQDVTPDLGIFVRASWNNGETETYAFSEIDRSVAAGAVLTGARWGRPDDQAGIAFVANGISGPHRDYLAAGGLGFFLGDGALNYGLEQTLEARYGVALGKHFNVGANYQHTWNPGYNRDRGPANFYGVRLHAEF